MWMFYFIHAADVWTTNEGMKWDCVYEVNPLLPKVPHLDRLLIHKAIFLSPYQILDDADVLTNEEMMFPIAMGLWVVYNNLKVIERAEEKCNLR